MVCAPLWAFPELKSTAGPDWSKKYFKPVNIDFGFEALYNKLVQSFFIYGRFEFDAVGGTKLMDRENAGTKETGSDQIELFKKECICLGVSESTLGALLLEKMFDDPERFKQM